MSAVYSSAVDRFETGDIDILAADLRAVMVGDDYLYDPAHDLIGDITAVIEDPVAVEVDHVADGTVYIDPVTFAGVPASPDNVTGLVFYIHGPGWLVCHVDRRADTIPLDVETDGGDLIFTFDRLFRL